MSRPLCTLPSDMTKVKPQRKDKEIYLLICLVIFIVSFTVTIIIYRRMELSLSEKCGPDFPQFSVNLSDAKKGPDGSFMSVDGLVYHKGTFYESKGTVFGCPCAVKPCIRKCCAQNELYKYFPSNNTNKPKLCVETNKTFDISTRDVHFDEDIINKNYKNSIYVNDTYYYVFYGKPCEKLFLKRPDYYDEDKDFLLDDGRILTLETSSPYRDQSQYCFESFASGETEQVYTFECIPEPSELREDEQWTFDVLLVGMLVSIPCLVATLVVYAILPQQQNLHGKCLMCHVFCLIVAYSTLSCVQFPESLIKIEDLSCKVSAFVIQFSFIACFCWLNVMCFDLWRVFNGGMTLRSSTKKGQLRKFLLYSLYAWGVPSAVIALTIFVEYTSWDSAYLVRPQFGLTSCWFKEFDARTLYFYLPVGVMVAVNLVMFSTTFCRLYSRKNDSERLNNTESQRHNVSERHRFNLYLNLFIVMGVSWAAEVASYAMGGSRVYWLATDLANSLQGLFIFVIFVCKRRILYQLNQRLCSRVRLVRPTLTKRYSSSRTNSSRVSTDNVVQMRRLSSSKL